MATNTYLTDDIITLEGLSILENEMVATKHTTRKYEALFGKHGGSARGDTVRIRKPNRYAVRSGATFSAGNIVDEYVNLTVDTQIGIDTEFSSQEMAQDLTSFSDQVLRPQISRLAHAIDLDVLGLYTEVPAFVGVPGTVPSSSETYLDAGVILDNEAAPRDGQRIMVVGPQMQAGAVKAFEGLFNAQGKIGKQYSTGEIGADVLGFNWNMSQNIRTYLTGTPGSTPTTDGATQSGSTIHVDTMTATTGDFHAGDIVTFGGVFAVNPITKESTGKLRQFVVTALATADGTGDADLLIYPALVATGVNQNVTNTAADGQPVLQLGAVSSSSAKTTAQGMAWHKSAIALAFQELPKPQGVDMSSTKTDKKLGISLRLVRWYDGDTDMFKCRFDVLYGKALVRPEWAVRVLSGAA